MCMLSGNGTRRQQENFKLFVEWHSINTCTPENPVGFDWHASSLGTMRLECCRAFSHSIFILGIDGMHSAPEIGVNFQQFGGLAPFPTPLPPRIRWGLIDTLLVWALAALIGAEHFHIQLNIGYRGGALSASAPVMGVNFQQFGGLAPFPTPLPPRIRWRLICTLLV